MNHNVEFKPSGRGKAQCPSDPDYLHGKIIDGAKPGQKSCYIPLPYPAPECGAYIVNCKECDFSLAVTVAGRKDDPTCIIAPCKEAHIKDGTHAGKIAV